MNSGKVDLTKLVDIVATFNNTTFEFIASLGIQDTLLQSIE